MNKLIRYALGTEAYTQTGDTWQIFRAHQEGEEAASLPAGKVIVPFAWWLNYHTLVQARAQQGDIALWFAAQDNALAHAELLQQHLQQFPLLAVDFPVFRDGRGMSTAALLRERFAWQGELRAIGDVLVDQLTYMARVGFDSFLLRNDQDETIALKQFSMFRYQMQDAWRNKRTQSPQKIQTQRTQVDQSDLTPKATQLWCIPENAASLFIQEKTNELNRRLTELLQKHNHIVFATSLAAEDMLLTHALLQNPHFDQTHVRLVTLNTERLHAETVALIKQTEQHYTIQLEVLTPQADEVEAFVQQHGLNGFYESETAKKTCCHVRKVAPLQKALTHADAWISGQRREQSLTRKNIGFESHDHAKQKYNPIFDWSETEVWAYIKQNQVLIHPLHLQGYPSIGCEPCTKAVRAGEDIRAGRWWWLQSTQKECGLHLTSESIPR